MKKNNILNPYYVTGFTDAEGCFNVTISPRSNGKYQVSLRFEIDLHSRDIKLLSNIQSYFKGVGTLTTTKNNSLVKFVVRNFQDIVNVIIPHYEKYPLLTQKQADFLLFKEIALLMRDKEHLTPEGLLKIAAIKSSINLGLSDKLLLAFPVEPYVRPEINTLTIPDPYWITGFAEGDSSFFVNLSKAKDTRTGYKITLMFRAAQHLRDLELLKLLVKYFNCGTIQLDKRTTRISLLANYTVTKLNDLYTILIPFFRQYPLMGIKQLDFEDFSKVAELMNNNEHKTLEGINKIIEIKANMNSNRII
jgi:hypothetical protein